MKKTYSVLVVLAFGLAGCSGVDSGMEIGDLARHDRVDILKSGGSVDGISIGMDLDEAKTILLRQDNISFTSRVCLLDNKDADIKEYGRTSNTPCPDAYEEDAYADSSFFHYGAFYITAYKRKVVRVKFRHSYHMK